MRSLIEQPVPPTRILPRGLITPQALYNRVETGDEAFERKVFVDSKDEAILDWFDAGLRQELVEHAKYGRKVMEFSIEGRNITYVAYGLLDSDKRLAQVVDAVELVLLLKMHFQVEIKNMDEAREPFTSIGALAQYIRSRRNES